MSLLSTRCTSRSVPPVVATTHPLEWTGDRQAHTNRVLPSVRKGWTCKGMWRQGSLRHPGPPLRRLLIPRIRASVWEEPGHDQVRVQNCNAEGLAGYSTSRKPNLQVTRCTHAFTPNVHYRVQNILTFYPWRSSLCSMPVSRLLSLLHHGSGRLTARYVERMRGRAACAQS